MIQLDVDPWCSKCLEFEADVQRPTFLYSGIAVVEQTDTIVQCEHRARCKNTKKYLEETLYGGPVQTE